MRRLPIIFLIFLSCALEAGAQKIGRFISSDYDFANFLIDRRAREDASALLGSTDYCPSDTLTFLRGWAAYNFKQLPEAADQFSLIPQSSPFYTKASYFGLVCNAYESNYSAVQSILDSYVGPHDELYYTEAAGLALLQENPVAYRAAASHLTGSINMLTSAQESLQYVYDQRYVVRQKSPWVAGLASAVVPGAGMWYAGDKFKGALTFFSAIAVGAIVAENNIHYGASDWRSILWDVAGAGFYIGNICGSVVTLRVQQQKIHDAQTTTVLYDMHIPLRSIFR